MTSLQMKQSLNAELISNNLGEFIIKKITEVGVNTCLVFKGALTMKLVKWLNDRFEHGISLTDTDHSIVFINTPAEGKTHLDALPATIPVKAGDNITIIGRRWFDSKNGNTYFSTVGLINGKQVLNIDFAYGYGNQYEHKMIELMVTKGIESHESGWAYCERMGITYYSTHSDVNRKKDL